MNHKTTKGGLIFAAAALVTGAAARFTGAGAMAEVAEENKNVPPPLTPATARAYKQAVTKTAAMVGDGKARTIASRHGLDILNVTWEDTGRYKGSSVGPNISDMTIQVSERDPRNEKLTVTCMPVLRYPNYSDKTADLDPRNFTLLVGNQKSGGKGDPALRRVSLHDFLATPTAYLSHPNSWKGAKKTLLAPERDSKVLVSAQACFLPVPKQGKATFNPVVFNYQSSKANPAVLTILATREGTSATIIDNTRDAFESGSVWGQRLFHNLRGKRASLTGQRESDFKAENPAHPTNAPAVGETETGLNMVLLIQVPLKYKEPPRRDYMAMSAPMAASPTMARRSRAEESNVENAVIGHGDVEGPFTEMDNLAIERDPRFPVRVTVQFYKATDNGVVSASDLSDIKEQIDRVYRQSDYVGSLVTEGETGRITEYEGAKVEPAGWWEDFWKRHEQNTGDSREVALAKLRKLLGPNYAQRPVTDLYLRNLLRKGHKG